MNIPELADAVTSATVWRFTLPDARVMDFRAVRGLLEETLAAESVAVVGDRVVVLIDADACPYTQKSVRAALQTLADARAVYTPGGWDADRVAAAMARRLRPREAAP